MAMPDLRRQSASVSPVPLALVERLGRHAECRIRHSKCRFCLIPLVARWGGLNVAGGIGIPRFSRTPW